MKNISPSLTTFMVTTMLALVAAAQVPERGNPLAFEAASVKKSATPAGPILLSGTSLQENRWAATRATLLMLIGSAYGSTTYRIREQIVGGPPWIDTDRFDITAVAQGRPTRDQFGAMVRTLLADRFKLLVHVESRELPVLALVVARKDGRLGPSLRRVSVDCESHRQAFARGERATEPRDFTVAAPCDTLMSASAGTIRLSGRAVGMPELARLLISSTGPLIVDRTGLTGTFDFDLEYVREERLRADATVQPDGSAPPLADALDERLGLKLERGRAPVEVLVIDRAELPASD